MSDIAENVSQFLTETSSVIGKMLGERWGYEMWAALLEKEAKSPIEHLFWIACNAQCVAEFVDLNPSPEANEQGTVDFQPGIYLQPQVPIGKYRVDFLLSQERLAPRDRYTPVVVELDGHEFHDKDKRQRAYEKARDRFFVREGYRVIHFTGSEVVADPFKVAYEALDLLGLFEGSREGYDKDNPLNLE